MPKNLRDAVVVITGASSGIGRATACEFAREGAKLVLAARNKKGLKETAQECEELGAETLIVETDVTEPDDVQDLAKKAVDKFERIDVWVNNAGVGMYGRFVDQPPDAIRQLLETNVFGYIYGARAALKQFEKQRAGVLINVSSQVALGGFAYSSSYGISKYAVRGLSDTLRQEYVDTDIHVCTVYPRSTDTPFFEHSANFSGREVQPIGSIDAPEKVAKTIVDVAKNPKPEVLVGKQGHLLSAFHAVAPETFARVVAKKTEQGHFQNESADDTHGNLFKTKAGATYGGWREGKGGGKAAAISLVAGGAALATYLLVKRAKSGSNLMRDLQVA